MKKLIALLLCGFASVVFGASPSFQQVTNIAQFKITSQLTSNNVFTASNNFKTIVTTNFMIQGTNGVNFTWEDGAVPSVQLIQGGTNYGAVMNFSPGTGKGQLQAKQLLANEIHDFDGSALRIQANSNLLVGDWSVGGDFGIGTNAPQYKLHVWDTSAADAAGEIVVFHMESSLYHNKYFPTNEGGVFELTFNTNGSAGLLLHGYGRQVGFFVGADGYGYFIGNEALVNTIIDNDGDSLPQISPIRRELLEAAGYYNDWTIRSAAIVRGPLTDLGSQFVSLEVYPPWPFCTNTLFIDGFSSGTPSLYGVTWVWTGTNYAPRLKRVGEGGSSTVTTNVFAYFDTDHWVITNRLAEYDGPWGFINDNVRPDQGTWTKTFGDTADVPASIPWNENSTNAAIFHGQVTVAATLIATNGIGGPTNPAPTGVTVGTTAPDAWIAYTATNGVTYKVPAWTDH